MDQQSSDATNTNSPKAEAALPSVPETWPGAFGLYKYSKKAVKVNWQTILVLFLAIIALSVVNDTVTKHLDSSAGTVVVILVELVAVVISIALTFTYLAGMREQRLSVGEALSKCTPMLFVKFIAMAIVSVVILAISLLLLIVPFFFVAPRLTLGSYFLLDKNMGPIESIKASWHATKGHALKVWGIILATIAMALLCVTIIGIPFSLYFLFMYGAAYALLYGFVGQNQQSEHAS